VRNQGKAFTDSNILNFGPKEIKKLHNFPLISTSPQHSSKNFDIYIPMTSSAAFECHQTLEQSSEHGSTASLNDHGMGSTNYLGMAP
jgi:hypothetical protein